MIHLHLKREIKLNAKTMRETMNPTTANGEQLKNNQTTKEITETTNNGMVSKSDWECLTNIVKESHKEISSRRTPNSRIKKRPDGFSYVQDDYMRSRMLEDYGPYAFDQVSLEIVYSKTPQQVGDGQYVVMESPEWVVFSGSLRFVDNGVPRTFAGIGASRVQYKAGQPHIPINIIDLDKQVKSARTQALKDSINRACNIADDVYGKDMVEYATEPQIEVLKKLAVEAWDYLNETQNRAVESITKEENPERKDVERMIMNLTKVIDKNSQEPE